MTKIKEIFGSDKNIYRPIEKVVTFGSASELNLKNEVSEYVVTDKLRDSFDKILDSLYRGMEEGTHEVGIWVAGFYGSGKSSFAKYLGFGLKKDYKVDNQLFLDRLSNRINSTPTTQLFKNIVNKFDPAVILLDCATEQIKGGTLPPILELMIAKVNQLAGFSSDEKLAEFERMLSNDHKLDYFKKRVLEEYTEDWDLIKTGKGGSGMLKAKEIASHMAHEIYPYIWKDQRAFKILRIEDMSSDRQKVENLLDTVRRITGKENIIFVVDEVGQYISAKSGLITSLAGTMENLKDIGSGKAWLLATAQQTLTEDNPNARLNSDKLYGLNARFPIKVEIDSSDIKEICTQRILGKSSNFSDQLRNLYKADGEKLRHYTKLEKCERTMYVKDELDEKLFINLYPFLPQHFEIIISLLGRLAKITGGVGLRSAIKVIQDILTEKLASESNPLAEFEVGKLATTYHIYDVLKADIRKSYSHIVGAVDKITTLYGESSDQAKVSKSIAVLQLLDDFYLSTKNVASLMHPHVKSDSVFAEVSLIIDELKNTPGCTLNEIDGQLRFMTDAIISIENEKNKITPSSSDIRKIYEAVLTDIFSPVPSARLLNTKTVRSGVNFNQDGKVFKLLETNEEIQMEVLLLRPTEYSKELENLLKSSTDRSQLSRFFLIGKIEKDITNDIIEIVKCEGIYNTRNRYEDKEINDYLNSQDQEAKRLKDNVRRIIIQSFEKGEFVFRGANKPVVSYGAKFKESANGKLKEVAELVFEKYKQAPIQIGGGDAEKLLTYADLKMLPQALNHFDLIKGDGSVDLDKEAIKSIREYILKEDLVEGKRLLDHFDTAPYGWSKDTTRFLVSAMFIASDIKLRVSGQDIKVKGPKAIEALKNVNGFNKIGISAYQATEKPSMPMLALSVQRLAQLTGDQVAPLQDKIAEVVRRHFPEFQTKYSSIKTRLEYLNLPGQDKAQEVQDGISEVLKGEGSDAAFRLGKPDSDLFENLKWIGSVYKGFEQGMESAFKEANSLKESIDALPDSGILKELKENTQKDFDTIQDIISDDTFFDRVSDLKDAISNIKTLCSDYCQKLLATENEKIEAEVKQIKSGKDWYSLSLEQQEILSSEIDGLVIENKQGLDGIKDILNSNYVVTNKILYVREQQAEYLKSKPLPAKSLEGGRKVKKDFTAFSKTISSERQLDDLISALEAVRDELNAGNEIEINW
ncbi:BREX system P-loop protein BrxC [Algoriphagus limi]|uniref:BREX system P-loop protein BrxC n=1 Tax=Algoriphagus limi TaxID=2975273 RepID=A0ABT2G0U6_9BACT|nr:BREX system P-loop protein BrxC [Algoriphagus limi]MCS5488898.1 BREX system P-loop protein BrxC [Algoriphagus limi]